MLCVWYDREVRIQNKHDVAHYHVRLKSIFVLLYTIHVYEGHLGISCVPTGASHSIRIG